MKVADKDPNQKNNNMKTKVVSFAKRKDTQRRNVQNPMTNV